MERRALHRWLLVGSVAAVMSLTEAALAQVDTQALARVQARILELEEEVRRLTGRLEQAEFTQRRLVNQIEQLSRQPAAALPSAEGAAPAGPSTAETATATAVATAPVNIVRPEQRQAGGSLPTTAPAEQSLGTIPREALLAIERPGEREAATEPQTTTTAALSTGGADERMTGIRQLLADGDWNSARPALERFLVDFPESEQADQASFWLGETWFSTANYDQAAAQFAENFRTYGDESPNAADNLLKLGMSLGRHGDVENACVAFLELERRFPSAPPALRQTMDRERRFFECS